MNGFEMRTFSAFDGALDVRLLGDFGRSWIVPFLTCFVVFALLCIRRTFLGAVARPRWAPRCTGRRQQAAKWRRWTFSSRRRPRWLWKTTEGRGPRLGDVMGFRWFLLSYLILLYYYTYCSTLWWLFCLLNVETSCGQEASQWCLSVLRH